MAHLNAALKPRMPRQKPVQHSPVAGEKKIDAGMALHSARYRGYDNARAGIATHRVHRNGQFAGQRHPSLGHKDVRSLALRLHDFAIGIMTAGAADMMRPLGLTAFWAIRMRSR